MGLGEGQDSQESCHVEPWVVFACVGLLFTSWLLHDVHLLTAEVGCVVWETCIPPGAQIKVVRELKSILPFSLFC